jgi:hypothetical protein
VKIRESVKEKKFEMKTIGPILGIAFALIAVLACNGAVAANRAPVIGDWYGIGQPHDGEMAYLDHIKPDGTYVSEFEVCKGKKSVHHVESGFWSASPDITRVVTKIIDGHAADFTYDYQMISNNGKTWVYKIVASDPENPQALGYQFNARRVTPDFRLPGCLQIS